MNDPRMVIVPIISVLNPQWKILNLRKPHNSSSYNHRHKNDGLDIKPKKTTQFIIIIIDIIQ